VLASFQCYGYGEFSCTANAARVVELTGNVTNFILYADSLSSSVNDAVSVNGITNCYMNIRNTIQSSIANGMLLELVTRGIIYAGSIFGSVRGIDLPTNSTRWYINCFSITGVTSNAVRTQGANNVFIDCVNINSVLSISVSVVLGNCFIRVRNMTSAFGTFVLDHIDGDCSVIGFDTLTGSNASAAVRSRGTGRTELYGDTITGIVITGGTPVVNAKINKLLRPSGAGSSNLLITGATGGAITLVVGTVIGGNASLIFRNVGAGPIVMTIIADFVDTGGNASVFINNNTGGINYVKVGRITSTILTAFDLTGGINYLEFDTASTITNNVPVVNVDLNSVNYIRGRTAIAAGLGNCLRIMPTATGTTTWAVDQSFASGNSTFAIDITGNPTLNFIDAYGNCSLNNLIGHVYTVTGAGTPVIKLFNCVGTKTNAAAKIVSSTNAINVLVYSTFTSNDTSTNTTFQVGNNLVSALVV
jgi:hypothetical protein